MNDRSSSPQMVWRKKDVSKNNNNNHNAKAAEKEVKPIAVVKETPPPAEKATEVAAPQKDISSLLRNLMSTPDAVILPEHIRSTSNSEFKVTFGNFGRKQASPPSEIPQEIPQQLYSAPPQVSQLSEPTKAEAASPVVEVQQTPQVQQQPKENKEAASKAELNSTTPEIATTEEPLPQPTTAAATTSSAGAGAGANAMQSPTGNSFPYQGQMFQNQYFPPGVQGPGVASPTPHQQGQVHPQPGHPFHPRMVPGQSMPYGNAGVMSGDHPQNGNSHQYVNID